MPNTLQNISLFLIVAGFTIGSATTSTCAAQEEDFDSAFSSTGLPWYDSDARDLKSTEAPKRIDSKVADRNRIPPKREKKKGQEVTTNPAAPAATAAANNSTFATIGSTVMYAIGGVLAFVLIMALAYGFLKLESKDGPGGDIDAEKRNRKIRDHIKHLPFEIEEQDGDFETYAEKSFRAGDYSNAVIYLFADVLVAMSESGVVRLQRGKTNRQYLNEIWDHIEIRPYYQKVMTAFEDAFFGKHEIEKSRAEECFSGRAAFDTGIEQIRKARFDAQQSSVPTLPPPSVSVEGVS